MPVIKMANITLVTLATWNQGMPQSHTVQQIYCKRFIGEVGEGERPSWIGDMREG